ncbi:MAG: hypothetical protein ACI86H_000050 [bacterium]|jgi:uncharacterized protein (TIGR01777 family)
MKVLISGSSGFIGKSLTTFLSNHRFIVYQLTRNKKEVSEYQIYWNPELGEIERDRLEDIDIVIHLAGENIASGRWSQEKKKLILESRIQGTNLLCKTLKSLKNPPSLLLSASAIGYYGNRGDELLYEKSEVGEGFLANVCQQWEDATLPAKEKGIRVVHLRFGMILGKGGPLKKMLLPFRYGLGGTVGSGNQYTSWMAIDDVLNAILYLINYKKVEGPVNMVSPQPITNKELTRVIGKILNRPTFMFVPAFGVRLVLGELADEILLASNNVKPNVLQTIGYSFRFRMLEETLEYLLR